MPKRARLRIRRNSHDLRNYGRKSPCLTARRTDSMEKNGKKGKFFKNIESNRLGKPQSMIQLSAFWCAPLKPSELLKERNATQKGFYLVCENHILNYIHTVNYVTCGQYFKQKRVHVCLLLPLFFCISPQQCGKCSYEKSCFYSHTANYITAG